MSLYELLLIIIVSSLLLKVEDIPIIITSFKKIRNYIKDVTGEFAKYLSDAACKDVDKNYAKSSEELEQVNHFIKEIIKLDGKYDGDYSIKSLKKYYFELVKSKSKIDQIQNLE